MFCGHCGATVPEDGVLCPECGAPIEGATRDFDSSEGDMYPVLATANLARLRGDFEEATARCIEVLRRYPNNATAHSLIGDIYADQGLLRDAAEWYKLALELDASNQADRRKLETLIKRLAIPAPSEPAGGPPEPAARARRAAGTGLSRPLGLGMGAVVVVLLAVLIGAVVYRRATSSELERMERIAGKPAPAARAPKPASTPTPTPAPAAAPESVSSEDELLAALRDGVKESQHIESVEHVTLDPRDQTALIVFRVKRGQTLQDTKRAMLRSVLEIARAASETDSPAQVFSLRAKATVGESRQSQPELALAADVERTSLASINGPDPTLLEIAGLLRDTWWHPALRQIGL